MIRILILASCAALTSCATTAGLNIEYRGDVGGVPVSVRYAGGKTSILVDSHGRPQPISQK
jgi:hypothetical protein